MAILLDDSVLIYNGYVFPGGTSTSLQIEPVRDGAERTVIYSILRVTVQWYVVSASGPAHEAAMTEIRNRLQKDGASYTYTGHGMGPVASTINLLDVRWGPKAGTVQIEPMGPIACRCTWFFEVAYPQCTAALGAGFPLAYNYGVTFTTDLAGYTTREISGYLEMPLTRINGSRSLLYTVDQYYEQIVPADLPGFERTTKRRSISQDKRRLDFTFVDEEQKGEYPANIASAEGDYRIQSFPRFLTKYTATLSATYTLAKNTPRQFAIDAFVSLMLSKTRAPKETTGKSSVILTSFSANEGLYKNADKVGFSASWVYNSTSFPSSLQNGGVFKPVPGTNWFTWRSSPYNQAAMSARGNAGLALRATDDAIVDLCLSPQTQTARQVGRVTSRQSTVRGRRLPETVTEENSWILYECDLEIEATGNQAEIKNLPKAPLKPPPPPATSPDVLPPNGTKKLVNEQSTTPDVQIQDRVQPTYRAWLVGRAVRAKFEIVPPRLISLGGVTVKEVKVQFSQRKWGELSELIWLAFWRIEYICEGSPTKQQIVYPGNPDVKGLASKL